MHIQITPPPLDKKETGFPTAETRFRTVWVTTQLAAFGAGSLGGAQRAARWRANKGGGGFPAIQIYQKDCTASLAGHLFFSLNHYPIQCVFLIAGWTLHEKGLYGVGGHSRFLSL
jgi:hypothetical protein